MSDGKDRRLLERLVAGDERALRFLYNRHAGLLAYRLRRSGASVEETEDILQETFLDVWRSSDSYRGESAVAAWLWGIASRKYRMLVRSEVRLRHREVRAATGAEPAPNDDELALSIDAGIAMGRLDQELRDALHAVAVQGMTVEEAASRLGIPVGTVKSRVHRARQMLRKEML